MALRRIAVPAAAALLLCFVVANVARMLDDSHHPDDRAGSHRDTPTSAMGTFG